MTLQGDPHRTLGVAPGASLNEIKSAYRRLAKQYHPDTAGERALSRFLAIQAAYEHLVDGDGRLRRVRDPWAPADPGQADAARPRASRDAWRARQAGGGRGSARDAGDKGTAEPAAGPGAGNRSSREPGARSGTGDDAGGTSGAGAHPGRGTRRATPGSTTYDEATEMPLDPEWKGGAWYGPSSGTYWTLNPREYADPRKHGPEYLARARRAAAGEDPAGEDPAGEDPGAEARARRGGGRRAT